MTKCPPEVASRQSNPAAAGSLILPADFNGDPLAYAVIDGALTPLDQGPK